MQRSRGISGYEFDVHRTPAADIAPTVRFIGGDERADAARDDADLDAKVHEPRPRDLRRADARAPKVDRLHDRLREVARLGVERLRQYQREVRRSVTERGISRTLQG